MVAGRVPGLSVEAIPVEDGQVDGVDVEAGQASDVEELKIGDDVLVEGVDDELVLGLQGVVEGRYWRWSVRQRGRC